VAVAVAAGVEEGLALDVAVGVTRAEDVGRIVGVAIGLALGLELDRTVLSGCMLGVTLAQPSKPSAKAAIKQYQIRRATTIDPIVGGARTHAKCHLAEPVGAA